jgi:hypothetical protein
LPTHLGKPTALVVVTLEMGSEGGGSPLGDSSGIGEGHPRRVSRGFPAVLVRSVRIQGEHHPSQQEAGELVV